MNQCGILQQRIPSNQCAVWKTIISGPLHHKTNAKVFVTVPEDLYCFLQNVQALVKPRKAVGAKHEWISAGSQLPARLRAIRFQIWQSRHVRNKWKAYAAKLFKLTRKPLRLRDEKYTLRLDQQSKKYEAAL